MCACVCVPVSVFACLCVCLFVWAHICMSVCVTGFLSVCLLTVWFRNGVWVTHASLNERVCIAVEGCLAVPVWVLHGEIHLDISGSLLTV